MANILSKKGMSHEEYLVKLLKGSIPFDEGAILLFARTTGLHFGVIMNDEYWCTNCDNDPEKWAGMFMYAGNLKFVDTTAGQMEMEDCYELLNLNAFGLPHGSTPPPSPSASEAPSQESTEVSVGKTDSDEEYLPPSKRPCNRSAERRRRLLAKVRKPVQKTNKRQLPGRIRNQEKNVTPEVVGEVVFDARFPPARCTRSSKRNPSAALGRAPDTTDVVSETDKSTNNKADKSTNGISDKSIEPQQGIDQNSDKYNSSDKSTEDAAKSTEDAAKSNDVTNKSDSEDTIPVNGNDSNKDEEAKQGQLNVQSYGLKKTVRKERQHKCQHCNEVFKLVKNLNDHNKTAHPDKPFKCHVCGRTYSSTNGLDRHSKVHTGLGFVCGNCPFACQFKYEMRDHLKKHTGTVM